MTVSDGEEFYDEASDSGSDFQDSGDESDDFEPQPKKKAKANDGKSTVKKAPAAKKTPPAEKPVPKKKAAPKAKSSAMGPMDNFIGKDASASSTPKDEDVEMEDAKPVKKAAAKATGGDFEKRTIEEIYKKKTQLEHILLRPDTYIGSTEAEEQELWVFDSEDDQIKRKKIKYVPGLYKIVDEILVNAADNKIRDPNMKNIKVIIDKSQNLISIHNDGKGIPITVHKEEQVYVPELIFGHLLTSSNYDDDEKKVTGGRNGYGAKLCNIFSTEFVVETADKERKLKYRQVFSNNMTVKGKPKVTSNSSGQEYTRISFKPDLAKFNMTEMDDDFEALIKKRVYDMAGCVEGVSVYLNGTRIPVKGFKQYVDLYTKSMDIRNAEGKKPIIHDTQPNPRWQVSFAVSDGQFNQVSFVNSICTAKGGQHVNHVADQIVKAIIADVQKKSNNKNIKPFQIKNHMCVFINCLIENPAFDSQTKENMTLRAGAFGSKYEISDKFASAIAKSGIIDNIVKWVNFKEEQTMTRADAGKMQRRLNIPKLEDANKAGQRPHNKKCTLILTEGDSAKALVLSGLSVVGRDLYGVFPLRGKLLNVRDASNQAIMSNAEITAIKQILGLKHGKTYTNVDELRYGKLMIMTDQDHDGSHIKGLIINFIDQMFPSLLDIPGFLLEFITPIIRCTHKRTKEQIPFFTIPEYEAWAVVHNKNNDYQPKYFKGLGTSDKQDARKYFSDLDTHMKQFDVASKEDRQLVDMAFNKTKVSERKEWLGGWKADTYIDHNVHRIKISDFVNKELMLFSMADNVRSIPSVVDGFKPTQRKVLFGAIKRKNTEIKVAQFASRVAAMTQYHHGENSVSATIINMAQDFMGSNNVNLLVPSGQFGTRHQGSKAAASPRYLHTYLHSISRHIYHADDDGLLNYLIEENQSIEPQWFVPVLPMVLVNGADGIGTGWSTTIPNYNPKDIIQSLQRLMDGQELEPIHPWYRGFKGEIVYQESGKYIVNGIGRIGDDFNIEIDELPVGYLTDNFKEYLEVLRDPKDKKVEFTINDYSNNSTDVNVKFTINVDAKNLEKIEKIGIAKAFKLTNNMSTRNLVCFDKDGVLKRYNSPEEIIREFYDLRLDYYEKRKAWKISVLEDQFKRLNNKALFMELVIDKKLVFIHRKEEDIVADMERLGLERIYPLKKKNVLATEDEDPQEEEGAGYDYLFSINMRGFTTEKVKQLRAERDTKEKEIAEVRSTHPKDFWRRDLDNVLTHWEQMLAEDEKLAREAKPLQTTATKRKRTVKKKVKKEEADDD